jgi:hypothetical protein
MAVKFNPFTGNLDLVDTTSAAGLNTQVQYNDGGSLAGSADLTWDNSAKELGVGGDINLDDGGTFSTTLQMVTPTANRTISFPDATGTVALVAGSSGQLTYNNAGAQAGLTSASIGSTGEINISLAGDDSKPPVSFTGSWFTGGTATTTKPQLLIEPAGTTSTAWDTNGTGLGINAPSGFTGNLLDLQVNGSSYFRVNNTGFISVSRGTFPSTLTHNSNTLLLSGAGNRFESNSVSTSFLAILGSSGNINLGKNVIIQSETGYIFSQRNGVNPQTFCVYNTYTDDSNYERGFLKWNSGVFEIGTEGAGTGSEQPVRITAATLNIPNLPTHSDDGAAGTGGLVAGDVYKTSTGELRIKL